MCEQALAIVTAYKTTLIFQAVPFSMIDNWGIIPFLITGRLGLIFLTN
jgi:hypothetical protein